MSVTNVYHKSRETIYNLTWLVGYTSSLSIVADCDGVVFKPPIINNISSILINGETPTFPYALTKGVNYVVTPTIINTSIPSTVSFNARKQVNSTLSVTSPTLLAENIQGTLSVFVHSSDSKATIIDSSLINSSNYISGFDWIVDPRTVIDLPTLTDAVWCSGFWNHLTDRFVFFANSTVGSGYFFMCEYHITGAKAGQIWNIEGTTQNAFTQNNTSNPQTWNNAVIYPLVDYNNDRIFAYGNRGYFSTLSTFNNNSWYFYQQDFLLLPRDYHCQKYSYLHRTGMFVNRTCFRQELTTTRLFNWYNSQENFPSGLDNITENIFHTGPAINIEVHNSNNQIASIGTGAVFRGSLLISASVMRRMLYTRGATNYNNNIILFDLDTVTIHRSEATITEDDVINYRDADYLNSIEMFCCLTDGTAGTQNGRRTIHFISINYDGVNPLLKFKAQLQFDSTYMFTNRIRY